MPTRPPSKSFEDLIVWQRAHRFVLAVYAASGDFPREELFGLTSQLRRAAVSIPANIAYHLILAHDLGYIDSRGLRSDLGEVIRLLEGYLSGILSHESS